MVAREEDIAMGGRVNGECVRLAPTCTNEQLSDRAWTLRCVAGCGRVIICRVHFVCRQLLARKITHNKVLQIHVDKYDQEYILFTSVELINLLQLCALMLPLNRSADQETP